MLKLFSFFTYLILSRSFIVLPRMPRDYRRSAAIRDYGNVEVAIQSAARNRDFAAIVTAFEGASNREGLSLNTHNLAIEAYGRRGEFDHSLHCLHQLRNAGPKPDVQSYLEVALACATAERWTELTTLIPLIRADNITPTLRLNRLFVRALAQCGDWLESSNLLVTIAREASSNDAYNNASEPLIDRRLVTTVVKSCADEAVHANAEAAVIPNEASAPKAVAALNAAVAVIVASASLTQPADIILVNSFLSACDKAGMILFCPIAFRVSACCLICSFV